MADYNQWMNEQLYAAAARLSPEALAQPRGAFFGSLLGTLNHLAVADTIWLQRFASHPAAGAALAVVRSWPAPTALDQRLFEALAPLADYRRRLDALILQWTAVLRVADLATPLAYASTKGVPAVRDFFGVLMHFFNHQTHHRGQATTLLSQAGEDVGVTDLLVRIPNLTPG